MIGIGILMLVIVLPASLIAAALGQDLVCIWSERRLR